MLVKELIKALRKLPQDAEIAYACHDHNCEDGECEGGISDVEEAPDAIKQRGYGVLLRG